MTGRLTTLLATAVAASALVAGSALAVSPGAGTFKGKTNQKKYAKRTVTITTDATGHVTKLGLSWRAKCRKPKKYWFGGTNFDRPTGDGDNFQGSGSYTSTVRHGRYTGTVTVTLNGNFPDANDAQGKFGAKVKVRDNKRKKQIDTCKVSLRFKAKRSA